MILEIKHYTDDQGNKLASIPLVNSPKRVEMYEEDLKGLIDRGIPLMWKLSLGRAFIIGKRGKGTTVARYVVDAGNNEKVRFVDGNGLNMRRENLHVTTFKEMRRDHVVTHVFE
jgi:hypothetical protein